ncbi:MAG TPA: ABC transporter substrate-binding protein [Eubacterium sp.]|jgi:ABC-type glycerol-3-phosphate transport system substrate-binding protein|nr:ABC transporter substrate-binding protein [Eubacterium sp.]HAX58657.1 ABC transporter substrate-binding protein [Eubacterium sp.]HAZ85450.1 ABC transporter substrate-binding protein [Eubacterium sp.]
MKQTTKKRVTSVLAIAMTLLLAFPLGSAHVEARTELEMDDYDDIVSTYSVDDSVLDYNDYVQNFNAVYPDKTITAGAENCVRYDEDDKETEPVIYKDYEGMSGDSLYTSENSLIEFEVDVKEEGFYNISLEYFPIKGKNSAIERSVFIDGELPYSELSMVTFYRIWEYDADSYKAANGSKAYTWEKDNQGNDCKPSMKENPEWISEYMYDSDGYITSPLSVYMTKGKHTITLLSMREPMVIHSITLSNAADKPSYAQVKSGNDAAGAKNTSGKLITIEGENPTRTSSQMLYPIQDQSSPSVSPSSPKMLLNNTIGGNSWRLVGQWIEWDFDVEESGYYNISLYDSQNFVRGIYVSRKITIDGEVPFKELEAYGFKYDQSWREDVLQDAGGTPYSFYLEAGHHTIRMEVVLGDFSQIISEVEDCVKQLNSIYREVIRVTGVSPDTYRDYQIERTLPGLHDELVAVRAQLDNAITQLRALTGKKSDKETVLLTMRDQLDDLIKDGDYFVRVIGTFKINVRACGNWVTQVIDQPLAIDRINIYSPDIKPEYENTSFFSKAGYECSRLFYSFVIDYNQIGNVAEDGGDSPTITLWIGSGRDQANVIKAMIDESFTNEYGVNVNVQLVDMSTLLRAELAGEGPDVAIQVANTSGIAGAVLNTGNDTPVNYGIRNAVLDLSRFSDLDEVLERFPDAAMTAFTFDGATYALPETITFPVMFYRKDILAELGLDIPETWADVKVAMTVLAKNQMEFGMLPSEQIFAMLLYQNGGEYYTEDGSSSLLDSDIAVNTFKEYCEYYTDFKLDKETSVEERFRTGECPIIIADYTTYNNLVVSAPDIAGLWDFVPVPGTQKDDGTIDRSTGCTGLASIIMADTEYPDACWQFLKWWTSADVQTQYGREMESLMGSAARVPTANLEAFANMPWPVDDYEALLEAFGYVKGIPQVPGGYYSWRNVNNAFYTVTTETDTASPREELMDKVIYINAEINYKREELGLPVDGQE